MQTRLPQVYKDAPVTPTAEFIRLWMQAIGERALLMRPDSRLAKCASDHAAYLASRTEAQIEALADDGHGSHVGIDGSTPNQRVRAAGYKLPVWHGDGNTVEFNTRTHRGPARALELLLGSDAHGPALRGEDGWQEATVYGVGHAGHDWVVLVCPESGG